MMERKYKNFLFVGTEMFIHRRVQLFLARCDIKKQLERHSDSVNDIQYKRVRFQSGMNASTKF